MKSIVNSSPSLEYGGPGIENSVSNHDLAFLRTQEPTQSQRFRTKSIPATQKIPRDLGSRVKNQKLELKMLLWLFSLRRLWGFRSPVPGTRGQRPTLSHSYHPKTNGHRMWTDRKKRYKWKYKTNDKMFHLFIRREMKI